VPVRTGVSSRFVENSVDNLTKLGCQLSAEVSKFSALEIGPTQTVIQGIGIGVGHSRQYGAQERTPIWDHRTRSRRGLATLTNFRNQIISLLLNDRSFLVAAIKTPIFGRKSVSFYPLSEEFD
jgi:hypothetical protein